MAISPKTIYLEPDEEITSVIDKIRKTEFSEVVLVVPKGASITQSVVNLKLIKRKAEELSKTVSIITGDKVARALADKIGMLSASSIAGLAGKSTPVKQESEVDPLLSTNEVIFNKEEVPIEVSELSVREDEEVSPALSAAAEIAEETAEESEAEPAKPKSLVPGFPWKKVLLFGAVPLLVILIAAFFYLPQAKASISMKSNSQQVNLNFIGASDASLDTEKAVVPVKTINISKEETKQFNATGSKDAGDKAAGTVEVYLKSIYTARTWVSGTRIALASDTSLVYVTDTSVTLSPGSVQKVAITASNPGTKYNLASGKSFVAVNDSDPDVTSVSAVSGGTTKMVTYVSQGDFDSAKSAYAKTVTENATADFSEEANGMKVIDSTKATNVVSATATPAVGSEGSNFTLAIKVEVKALAVKTSDLSALIKAEVKGSLGNSQDIIDDGSDKLAIQVDSADLNSGAVSGTVTTTAYVSNKLDKDAIKTQLEGLNDAQAINYLKGLDGVTGVTTEYFPGFIKSFPRIKDHIIINTKAADAEQ